MKKLIIILCLLTVSVATMANNVITCLNGGGNKEGHDTGAYEAITIEPVVKHEIRLNGWMNALPLYEIIETEPVLKKEHDLNLVHPNSATYENITLEPVVSSNLRLNGMQYAYLYEELPTDLTIREPKQLMPVMDITTDVADGIAPEPREEIAIEPQVKTSKSLQQLIDAVENYNQPVFENILVEPVIKSPNFSPADTTKPTASKAVAYFDAAASTIASEDTLKKNKAFSKDLDAVVVTSRKPPFERKADKMIVNVEANITNSGASAMEVLEKTPGVSVDKDGNISMAGKNGVMVLIDGKRTFMTPTDLADYLRNVPASSLDKLEVMTNPSAKYDAAGNSGIINIVTKKQKQKGFNGSLSTSTGFAQYLFNNNSLNLNYRKNKLNLFANLSGNTRKSYDDLQLNRTFFRPDGTPELYFDQKSENTRRRNSLNAKIGFDHIASPQTTWGMVFTGFYSPGKINSVNTSYLKNHARVLDSTVVSTNYEERTWKNAGVNWHLVHQFDSARSGKEISVDLDYYRYNRLQDQEFLNENFDLNGVKSGSKLLQGHLPSDIEIMSAKTDYTQKIFKKYKLETGLKYSQVRTENVAGYFDVINNIPVPNDNITNSFDYEEAIGAAYLNMSATFGKWSVQAGLRAEHTRYKGFQYDNALQPDSTFTNDYTSLFPTFYASHKLNAKHNFTMSYGRRINRPDYADLNPFRFFIDQYTYAGGNPFLRPMYTNVVEAGHSFKNVLHTRLSYSKTNELITQTFETDGFAAFVRPGNYGTQEVVNLNVTYQFKPKSWFNSTIYTEATHNIFDGMVSGKQFNQEGTTVLLHMNNQFILKKGWSAELSGYYRTKGWEGQVEVRPVHLLNAGVQKKVLKDKGTLKLALNNLLQYQVYTGTILLNNAEAKFRNNQFSRSAALTFTYRFGKPLKGTPVRKQGGSTEELNRVKSS